MAGDTPPEQTTLYYDPQLDVHLRMPVSLALTTAYYAAPQFPDDARRLFEAACQSIGLDREPELPLRPSRAYGSALILAREWQDTELADRIATAIEASFEPTWDDEKSEFTWGLGLNEPHPRGQYNAFLAAAEASGPNRWTDLSAKPLETCPQIVDVDFPTMAFSRAEWVRGALHLSTAPLYEDPKIFTSFRIVGAEPRVWYLTGIDGAIMDVTQHGVIVHMPLVRADLEFVAGSY